MVIFLEIEELIRDELLIDCVGKEISLCNLKRDENLFW